MQIKRLHNVDEYKYAYTMMFEYMPWNEIVTFEEYIYFTDNFSKLKKGEDYLVYRVTDDFKTLGVATMVLLDELVLIDCLVVQKEYREYTNEVIKEVINVAKSFKRPIVAEVKSGKFCNKLCNLFSFQRFEEPYNIIIFREEKISQHSSNLLYLNESVMDFEKTKRILYEKYYFRWKKHFYDKMLNDYKNRLGI